METNLAKQATGFYLQKFANKKELPSGFEWQALMALSFYPELRNTHIKFRIKHTYPTAKTRPSDISVFLPKKSRTYIITISDQSIDTLQPILMANLPYDAQVGLMGHELGHVADFSKKNFLQNTGNLFGHLSPSYLDKMEYNTDLIAIQHGLGKYLKAWSQYIRTTFQTKYWRGSDYVKVRNDHIERYMNPDTIEKYMQQYEGKKN